MRLGVEADVSAAAAQQQAVLERLTNPRGALVLLGGLLADYERDLFASRGHGQWAANDPATVRLKNSGRVLVDTGDLLRHLTDARIEDESVVVSSGSSTQAEHLKRGDRGMPKRDPAPAPPASTIEDWAAQVLGYLVDGRR